MLLVLAVCRKSSLDFLDELGMAVHGHVLGYLKWVHQFTDFNSKQIFLDNRQSGAMINDMG